MASFVENILNRPIMPSAIETVKALMICIYDAIFSILPFFFILGLALGHNIAEYSTVCILMIYQLKVIGKDLVAAAIIMNLLDGLSGVLAFILSYVANAYTDRFNVIVFSTASYIMGLILLWITASFPKEFSLVNMAVVLIALGKGGGGSTVQSLLEYQLKEGNNISREDQTAKDRRRRRKRDLATKICWYVVRIFGYAIALTIALGKASGSDPLKNSLLNSFKISAMAMLGSFLIFFFGFCFYNHEKPTRSSLGHIFEAFREAKSNKLHLWASFIPYGLVLATGNTLFLAHITDMNNVHFASNYMLPVSFLFVLKSITSDIVVFLFSFSWRGGTTKKYNTMIRIGAGIICAVFCCLAAWLVEFIRLHIISQGMSVLSLIPQYFFLGLMEGLAGGGLVTYIYNHVPKSMRSFAEPFTELVLCTGKFSSIIFMSLFNFWFGQSVEVSKLDRYFLILAILCFIFFLNYLIWWRNDDNFGNTSSGHQDLENPPALVENGHEEVPEVAESKKLEDNIKITETLSEVVGQYADKETHEEERQ